MIHAAALGHLPNHLVLGNHFSGLSHVSDEVDDLCTQEEKLLRELLLSPSSNADQQEGMHHTHSDEQWLVSSETKKARADHCVGLQELQEQLQLQSLLQEQLSSQLKQEQLSAQLQQEQLSTQLQQERDASEDLQHSLEQQQQANQKLQHQLEASYVEAEELRCQLDMVHQEVEEAHERAQLQELLTEQLQTQLQEVTQQKDEYAQLSQQHESAIQSSEGQQVSF